MFYVTSKFASSLTEQFLFILVNVPTAKLKFIKLQYFLKAIGTVGQRIIPDRAIEFLMKQCYYTYIVSFFIFSVCLSLSAW